MRLKKSHPYEAKLQQAMRLLPFGYQNRFLVKLCREKLGDISDTRDAVDAIVRYVDTGVFEARQRSLPIPEESKRPAPTVQGSGFLGE